MHVLQRNVEKFSIYIFCTIEASSGGYRHVKVESIYTNLYPPEYALSEQNRFYIEIFFLTIEVYLQSFTNHHHSRQSTLP